MKIFYNSLFGIITMYSLIGCSEEYIDNGTKINSAKLNVSLVDAPASYESVFIDIQDVKVNIGGNEETGWQSLNNFTPGVFDILKLTNGEEASLGDLELPEGKLSQIRLILGDNNSLVVDRKTVKLKVPSGSQSGLKIKINQELLEGKNYKLIIDFDAGKSIVKAGKSGKFILKPVLRGKLDEGSGSISGKIIFENTGLLSSGNKPSIIYAIHLTDTISTFPNDKGEFLIQALDEGYYNIIAQPTDRMENSLGNPIIQKNIEVKKGATTALSPFVFK